MCPYQTFHSQIHSTNTEQQENKYQKIFPQLPPWNCLHLNLLDRLANLMFDHDNEPSNKPAGYTYLGQFIAHEITFDPTAITQKQVKLNQIKNYRTPAFDLDSVYGGGPKVSPYLYTHHPYLPELSKTHFHIGKTLTGAGHTIDDLPRYKDKDAIISDPRNDENVIISQLHTAFLKLHNSFADQEVQRSVKLNNIKPVEIFNKAQRLTKWHFQWVVLYDYLLQFVEKNIVEDIFKNGRHYYRWKYQAFIPLEFSAAVFRFGHVQIQQLYTFNKKSGAQNLFSPDRATYEIIKKVDWSLFFTNGNPQDINIANKIFPLLPKALRTMPPVTGTNESHSPLERNIALRDLYRGFLLKLPSGQHVAEAMGESPLPIKEVEKFPKELENNTPLWYYVLYEAKHYTKGERLGPVGGRILAEVIIGLLQADPSCFFNQDPFWRPDSKDCNDKGQFGMVELLKKAKVYE